jgi:hypothetical protein
MIFILFVDAGENTCIGSSIVFGDAGENTFIGSKRLCEINFVYFFFVFYFAFQSALR